MSQRIALGHLAMRARLPQRGGLELDFSTSFDQSLLSGKLAIDPTTLPTRQRTFVHGIHTVLLACSVCQVGSDPVLELFFGEMLPRNRRVYHA